jgi:hypothetical protein
LRPKEVQDCSNLYIATPCRADIKLDDNYFPELISQALFRRVSIRPPTHTRKPRSQTSLRSPLRKQNQYRCAWPQLRRVRSGIGAFFGNLFGPKRDSASPNMRKSSVTQSVQPKSQPPASRTSGVPARTKATAAAKETPEVPRTANMEPPPDTGGTRTNLLVGAVPTVPAELSKIGSVGGIKPGR